MKIGVDISALQGAHRMRGIGYVAANFISHLPSNKDVFYVFYLENTQKNIDDILKLISLKSSSYELRYFKHEGSRHYSNKFIRLPMNIVNKIKGLKTYRFGDKKYTDVQDIDFFIQLDQSQPLPKLRHGAKNAFIAYDLIPYIMEADYLINYRTSRKLGNSRKASINAQLNRYIYLKKIRLNVRRAHKILSISNTTKKDFRNIAGASDKKTIVITLGVTVEENKKTASNKSLSVRRYKKTSWGYMPYDSRIESGNFLLFVGGADNRRRLQDLVTAFNHLRARGNDIKLVLSGDIMQGPLNIPNRSVQDSLLKSSYKDDIYFLGFTEDNVRDWLYEHALAFVFPSVYEGFGLPVLEAMGRGAPVVCYKNGAVEELVANIPFFAYDATSMQYALSRIIHLPHKDRAKIVSAGLNQASKFSWESTTRQIITAVTR